ncbi:MULTISPECIES: hypothetical protein [Mycobacteriaceae]|uniref:hypothetical protein n=1 Tax=Mycobacteriaceae TaxID=1762 RepID=UPI0012EA981F|nr:hypothetical protein [Mycobacterium sp. 852013-50091_SCH5140682]
MKSLKRVAVGAAIAGALGVSALGLGSATANAAPLTPGVQWSQGPWHHGGWGGGPGWGDGPGWGPPPPPPYVGYGGWAPPCVSGPLGFVQVCA